MNLAVTSQAAKLLAEYSADHQHPFNRLMHSICVPLIAIALIGLLWAIPLPEPLASAPHWVNPGVLALVGLTVYYLRLAPRLGLGMLVAALATVPLIGFAAEMPIPLWLTALDSLLWAGSGSSLVTSLKAADPPSFAICASC